MNAPQYPLYRAVTLSDKYTLSQGKIYLTGTQALVRLMLLQSELDRMNGLNTGGFVSGYRARRWVAWTRPFGQQNSF